MINSQDLRKQFIDYFVSLKHKFVPSWPVIPFDDPTLLFTNAGMNQFKPIFLGLENPRFKRAVNSQKCIRVSGKHNDLEEVGKDTYHHTFFEMLGNWSFGDYYKAEAIEWAWRLLTEVWKLDKERLWATVYKDDDESADLWKKVTDIDPSRILRFGEKDNFWEMGETGPCGPCSEIHYYRGKNINDQTREGVNVLPEYIELWNLVFIQYNRSEDGSLEQLPQTHVDTGAGFERILAVMQNVESNYETDLFMPIIRAVEEISGVPYQRGKDGTPHRVLADHVRMLSFSIADGALPSNEGRGYVLRRILRRAARYGRMLNLKEAFIYKLVPVVEEILGESFPEIRERSSHVKRVIRAEEENFNITLDRGLDVFSKILRKVKSKGANVISGKDAFLLYDTYGFPLDLTRLMAEEEGLSVEEENFRKEMQKQRQRARKKMKFRVQENTKDDEWIVLEEGKDSLFVGYDFTRIETSIRRYVIRGDEVILVLSETPFYAESGGQVGDSGIITGEGFRVRVSDTRKINDNTIIHIGRFTEGNSINSPQVVAQIDEERRNSIRRNHTATHLLQAALRKHLGDHVHQSGSLVAPDRLRFDFTHYEKLTDKLIKDIEDSVNHEILRNLPVRADNMEFEKAREKGAMALFGEKYSDVVRVISVEGVSMELCGGTHVNRTGDIGAFKIVSESGIAAGVRRIEAVTGYGVVELVRSQSEILSKTQVALKCSLNEIPDKAEALLEEIKNLKTKLKSSDKLSIREEISGIVAKKEIVENVSVATGRVEAENLEQLKEFGDELRDQLKSGVGVLFSEINGKPYSVCIVTADLIKDRKLKAGSIIGKVGKMLGGGGGGQPHMATAGGKEVEKIDGVIPVVPEIVKSFLKGE